MLALLFVRQILAYVEFEIGKIRTVVGTGEKGYAGAGGPAIECLIGEAYGCAFDINGNLYICDRRNHTVRRIDKVPRSSPRWRERVRPDIRAMAAQLPRRQ